MIITTTRWWKTEIKDKDCVEIGRVTYHKTKVPRVCKKCGYVFAGKLRDKFCSDVCRDLYRAQCAEKGRQVNNARRARKTAEALPAGVKVQKATVTRVEREKRAWRPIEEKICPSCGLPFKPANRRIKHCSDECRSKNSWKNKKRICPICKKSFFSRFKEQLSCSEPCGKKLSARTRIKV